MEAMGKQKGITMKPAVQSAEEEGDQGTLVTYARTLQRRSEADTGTSARRRRTPWPNGSEDGIEGINTSLETPLIRFIPHGVGLTPNPLAAVAPMAGDDQNAKLATSQVHRGLGAIGSASWMPYQAVGVMNRGRNHDHA